ncbi:site-specific DNA-methyltransferase [Neisseria leonii]|uniref:site-specific DNA-methyltransferase n=1 Tax=Neisseria leonii TaxID=2995413 RepID=UPI00237B5693|nr:site-specific DNA-methyltransferase [Neisseria sp. 3986]MDD9324968.1 site-specific DNA-methyltransferase [Neisseria sp. 3986]
MSGITREILFPSNAQPENSQLAILKQHFPNCFDKNGAFLPDKMAEELHSSGIATQKEGYSLNWLGKSYAKVLKDAQPETLLAENIAHNQQPENQNSQNLLIKGDNLEVLKHLKNAYKNQIKMIYIDPPYNTGSDGFVYQDDRKFTPEQLAELGGMDLDEAKRVLEFTAKKSNSHSAWLTFMYPRLYVARELLHDDGVIFISIDDNEQAQLKILCDEIFGEENFVAQFLWKKKSTTSNVTGAEVSSQTDYQLCYKKSNIAKIKQRIKLSETRNYPNQDELGNYRTTVIEKKDTGSYKRETMKFEILGIKPREGKRWQIGKDKAEILEKKGRFIFDGEKIILKIYDFEDENTYSAQPNLLDFVGTTDSASSLVNETLLGVSECFSNPKPIELLKFFIENSSNPNDLILDFFAGSGTTAHAVMQLNADDGGNRQFICVQLPELTDKNSEAHKAGYHTIFDITHARIQKAAAKIRTEHPDYSGDLGFKIFETVPNFQAARDEDFDPTQPNLPDTVNAMLSDEQLHTLLTTWRVYDGSALPEKVQTIDLAGYTAYYCRHHLYLLASGFHSECVKALIEKLDNDADFVPERIVLFGANMDSAIQKELAQAVKTYTNKKGLNNLSVLARY